MKRENAKLYEAAADVLNAEAPITLRGLMYRIVSRGALPDTSNKSYTRIGRLMVWARENGHVPLSMIVDNMRERNKPSSWSGLAEFCETVRESYRRDFWESLPVHVAVFCEKDAIAGTIQPVTWEYDVPLYPCRGYASISFAGSIAEQWKEINKPIFVFYCGDFDPSGFDIERDLKERLARFSGRAVHLKNWGGLAASDNVIWERLGVVEGDFDEFNLIELAVKLTDKRSRGFIEDHGRRCAEIDAIPPTELRRRIKEAILRHVDMERWAKLQDIERLEAESFRSRLNGLGTDRKVRSALAALKCPPKKGRAKKK